MTPAQRGLEPFAQGLHRGEASLGSGCSPFRTMVSSASLTSGRLSRTRGAGSVICCRNRSIPPPPDSSRFAGEHLVEGRRQAVDIAPGVDRRARPLLRAPVSGVRMANPVSVRCTRLDLSPAVAPAPPGRS